MFHKISNVKPLDNYLLRVSFIDGEVGNYDMKKLIDEDPRFDSLIDFEAFSEVCVDAGGYGISWNDDLDLSAEELWDNSVKL